MSSPYPLFRLLWRPLALAFAWGVFMGSVWPLLRLSELEGGPFLALWHRGSEPLVRSAAWQLGVLFPLFLGGVLASARADLWNSMLGWTLPGVRRGIATGLGLVAVPVVAGFYFLLLRGGPPEPALAAAALAGLWFVLPSALAAWRGPQLMIALSVVGFSVLVPSRYGELVSSAPLLAGAVAGVLALVLFRDQFSASTARRQTPQENRGWKLLEGGLRSRLMGEKAEWSISLAHSQLWPWIRAMVFETGSGSIPRYLKGVAVGALFFAGYALLMGRSGQAAMLVGVIASSGRLRLNSGLAYPISRRRRAGVAYVGAVLNMALLLGGITALMPIIGLISVPETWFLLETSDPMPWLAGAGATWILLPLVLWPAIVAPPERAGTATLDLGKRIGPLTLYVLMMAVGLNFVPWLWERADGKIVFGLWVVSTIISYGALWSATQRRYARMDLSAQEP